jgi:hypothetical protein
LFVLLALWHLRSLGTSDGPPRVFLALGLASAGLAVLTVGGRIALRLPGVPYNVRELAGDYPELSMLAIGVTLMACGAVPTALAAWSARRPAAFAKLFGPIAFAIASAVFLAVWLTIPVEAIDDIVGTPIFKAGNTFERWWRFVGLFVGPLAGWTLGARLVFGRWRPRSLVPAVATTLVVMAISYVVVVPYAATDNIEELLRNEGGWTAGTSLAAYLVATSLVSALLARALVVERRALAWLAPIGMLALSVPVTWLLFVLATNPRLDKYDRVFSARQFLLSPDREHYLDDRQIFERFTLAQLGLTGIMALGAAATLALRPTEAVRSRGEAPHVS